jgi:large subunit ribosomal protein L2
MGKRIIAQARGKGGPRYRAPSFKYAGAAKHQPVGLNENIEGAIIDIITCRGHSAPLAVIKHDNGKTGLVIASEGMKVGEKVTYGQESEIKAGNTKSLKDVPEGTLIYNIESRPGDGGKFCRASGTFARVLSKLPTGIVVELPSKRHKTLLPGCRASIGIVAGGGRPDKPFLKAGKKHFAMKAKNKLWPKVAGQSMNAVDHPHGGSSSAHKNYPYTVSRNAPPGAKVGSIAARRTGRSKK